MKNLISALKQFAFSDPESRKIIHKSLDSWLQNKLIEHHEYELILSVLQFSQLQVRDVMIPRSQMVALSSDDSIDQLLSIINIHQHSRYPVWDSDSKDSIAGLILAKDLINTDLKKAHISTLVRKPVFVPESQRLDTLLRSFKLSHIHMAIVVDEFGSVSGLITIEDVLEQIVGDIEDEHDDQSEQEPIKNINGATFVQGNFHISDFNAHFNTELDTSEFDTIAGIVAKHFGKIPAQGDCIEIQNIKFKVHHADKKRIISLEVMLLGQ
tara:strand:+ start:3563 stop:4366 length:804 start_codon:yes stop_codon:yes gene_type:complete